MKIIGVVTSVWLLASAVWKAIRSKWSMEWNAKHAHQPWHHAVLTKNGTEWKLYIDGEQIMQPPKWLWPEAEMLKREHGLPQLLLHLRRIAPDPHVSREDHFVGHVDEFAIYDKALERSVIHNHYSELIKDTPGLVSYWPLAPIQRSDSV